MTEQEMQEIARGGIERHLGDCEVESEDEIYDNAYCLALDALMDAKVSMNEARLVASDVAQCYAQP